MKRVIDLSAAVGALLLLLPLLVIVALLVRTKLGSPVLFRQLRPGLHGEAFAMLKFRSMTDARDASGELLPDAERLTSFGKFLRSSSLDELPGLWNIVRGDMSLVGPRPLLMDYLPLYSVEQARRHDVRPGLTGWAQVNGRNALQWEEKFALDCWYVDNRRCGSTSESSRAPCLKLSAAPIFRRMAKRPCRALPVLRRHPTRRARRLSFPRNRRQGLLQLTGQRVAAETIYGEAFRAHGCALQPLGIAGIFLQACGRVVGVFAAHRATDVMLDRDLALPAFMVRDHRLAGRQRVEKLVLHGPACRG
jgi:sugar transferase EpsL